MFGQIGITILSLLIGLFGIALLIGVGEALNNAVAAFAAVSLPRSHSWPASSHGGCLGRAGRSLWLSRRPSSSCAS